MHEREAGVAMITVALAVALILSSIVVMLGMSQSTQTSAQNSRRDDTVVAGAEARVTGDEELGSMLKVLLSELPLKQAVGLAAKLSGRNRNECYQLALELKDA